MRMTTKELAATIYGKVTSFYDNERKPIWFVRPTGAGISEAYTLLERMGLVRYDEKTNRCRFISSAGFDTKAARFNDTDIVDAKTTKQPQQRLTVDGYTKRGGSPTDIVVKIKGYGNRWRRVYVVCFSNSGSLFVKVDGIDYYINLERHDIEQFEAKRPKLKPGYAYESSRANPAEPSTAMMVDSDVEQYEFQQRQTIDGNEYNRFYSRKHRLYAFQLAILS